MGKIEDQIIEVLRKSGRPMALTEIAQQMDKPPKKIFSSLRKLFEAQKIDCDQKARTYTLAKQ